MTEETTTTDIWDAPPRVLTKENQSTLGELSRLVYLAAKYRSTFPRTLKRYIPHADLLSDVAQLGIEGTKVNMGVEMPSLEEHFRFGQDFSPDPGSDDEFRIRIARVVDNAITYHYRDDLSITERTRLYRNLDDFVIGGNLELIGKSEASLEGDTEDVASIMKWKTGLDFLDRAFVDGAYQGLHIIMGNPGTGKTSTLLLLMAMLRRQQAASSLWYFSLETPLDMVRWRMTPLRQDTKFVQDDRIVAGMTPVSEVLERIRDNPDPNRIILYDGPDVMSGGGDGRRFVLEDIFRELVQVKQACKAVFVPSQPRRGENQGMSLESVAEAWAKAWYSDTVFGIERLPHNTDGGDHRLKISNFKNRFGPMGKTVYYNINYKDFSYVINDGPSWDVMPATPRSDTEPQGDW